MATKESVFEKNNGQRTTVATFKYAPENKPTKTNYLKPVLASLVMAIGSIIIGTATGYPSTSIPNINANRNPFHVNQYENSWFGSISCLAGIPGSIASGYAMDKFGRKLGLLTASLPLVVGWTIIAGAPSINFMYVGRLLVGFFCGFMQSMIEVYISEVAPPDIRGRLMSFHELFLNCAVLMLYVVGTYVPWNWLAIVCAVFPCLLSMCLMLVPETPRWLVFSGRKQEAIESLTWFRGAETNFEQEIASIQESLKDETETTPWKDYLKAPLLKCLVASQLTFILQELSGINVVRYYTVSLFQESGTNLNANVETIIFGAVLVVSAFTSTNFIIDRFERRTMLLVSNVTMGVSMFAMGVFFRVKSIDAHFAREYISWLPLVSMIAVAISFVLGSGPIPYIITNEMFSTRARARASSLGVSSMFLFCFLTTKFFVNLSDAIGMDGAFWFCAGVCLLGSVGVFFTVPNTRGKTLEEIQASLAQ